MGRIGIAFAGVVVLIGASLCLSGVATPKPTAKVETVGVDEVCRRIVDLASRADKKGLDLLQRNLASQPASTMAREPQEGGERIFFGQLAGFQDRYGAFLGCDLAEQEDLSNSVRECVYMAKYQKNVIRWTFLCYRPHDKWKILGVQFKDLMGALLPQN